MQKHPELWRTEADGALAAEAEGFRLVVPMPKRDGDLAHFLVLQKQDDCQSHSLVRSGTEDNVRAAMKAAEHAVARLLSRPHGNPD